MILELQKGIIYGPVNSRRLGRSLGINILPPDRKVCPFNCVYCQYGWTGVHTAKLPSDFTLPSVKSVSEALRNALLTLPSPPAYITFSGNGEPTLHPEFSPIVEEVTQLRNEFAPGAKTAILSNSALVTDNSIRSALEQLDLRIMKLDCGTSEVFQRYNQPCSGVNLDSITDGLIQLSGVTIQTLLSAGQTGNLESRNITEWIEILKKIKPLSVQLYTLDRGYPDSNLLPVSIDEMNEIENQARKAGIPVTTF
jgi:wyosine [tRNA(Phe)-imidazoG37] synthetase (radical SAM superfamily)